MVEDRHEVEQREDTLFAKGIEDLVGAREEKLFKGAYGVKLLDLYRNQAISEFLRYLRRGAGVGDVDCLMRPAARHWQSPALGGLEIMGLGRCRQDVTVRNRDSFRT